MTRKAMSKKLRFEVFKRDGFCCQYCGAKNLRSSNRTFRYFCGVCWTKIREAEDGTR